MKDRIMLEPPVLGATMKGLGSMYRSLAALHDEVYPANPVWFALMAQGYIKQMRDLLDELDWLAAGMAPQELTETADSPTQAVEVAALLEAA